MAGGFLGRIKDASEKTMAMATKTAITTINSVPIAQSANLESKLKINDLKNQIKLLVKEKSSIYLYMGMEIYDLHKEGSLDVPQVAGYYQKLIELDEQLKKLEEEKNEIENISAARISSVPQKMAVCVFCQQQIKEDSKFCPNCGKSQTAENNLPEMIECVCGAEVEKGQPMCLECGRRIG